MEIFIGCSGYNYKEWKNLFYPEDIPAKKQLEYYARHFNTVEINSTYYNFPRRETLDTWLGETPDNFVFTIKANRLFTHRKKLKNDDQFRESLDRFQNILDGAKSKVKCVLWQLPRNLHKNIQKIESLAGVLDHDIHHVVEFRHESWFDQEVYNALKSGGLVYCILSAPDGLPEDVVITGRTAYIRFHGKDSWYDYLYSDDELEEWKKRIENLSGVDRVFIYFNNDQHGNAVKNAGKLKSLFNL